MSRFELFGTAHLAALAITALAGIGLVRAARTHPGIVRGSLAVMLPAAALTYAVVARATGTSLAALAPLHLCDFAIFVAVYALARRAAPLASELVYFWAGSGTLLAMVMPAVWSGFPSAHFLAYFALHGGVVVAAAVLVFGCDRRPRAGAPLRALLWTNAYAACVAAVNLAFDANYLYLREKPGTPTLLDWFGPWPVYILVAEGVALLLFVGLHRLAGRGDRVAGGEVRGCRWRRARRARGERANGS